MQRPTFADVIEEVLPIRGAATGVGLLSGTITFARLLGPLRCARVAVLADEEIDDLVDELARFLLADVR
jgi:hypothetical protein